MRTRRLIATASLVGVVFGGAAACAWLRDGTGAAELLPDLDQAVPGGIEVEVHRSGGASRFRLVFLSAVDNVGRGSLVVEGRRADLATPTMDVRQLVRRADGSTASYAVRGEIRYVRSETHQHWHLLRFERYELRRPADGELVAPDRKTGFCLGDRYDTAARVALRNEPARPVWTRECGKNRAELLRVREGISPGYGDDYVPSLEGQYVDVTGVAPGRYLLVHRVNPERSLRESAYGNNAASVLVELRWPGGRSSPPTVTVLARCPESDRCGRR